MTTKRTKLRLRKLRMKRKNSKNNMCLRLGQWKICPLKLTGVEFRSQFQTICWIKWTICHWSLPTRCGNPPVTSEWMQVRAKRVSARWVAQNLTWPSLSVACPSKDQTWLGPTSRTCSRIKMTRSDKCLEAKNPLSPLWNLLTQAKCAQWEEARCVPQALTSESLREEV